jgi:hypothetical protein
VLLVLVPSFSVHAIGLFFLMGFNDPAALILNERVLTRQSGQWVRLSVPRSCNIIMALTGPLLFSVFPQLPYIVAGVLVLCGDGSVNLGVGDCNQAPSNEIKPQPKMDKDDIPRDLLHRFELMSFARQDVIA